MRGAVLTARANDLLYGVYDMDTPTTEPVAPVSRGAIVTSSGRIISPATRVRYVHELLSAPPASEKGAGKRWASPLAGGDIFVGSKQFPHLVDMTPLHDRDFDQAWISAWSRVSLRSVLNGIRDADLEDLRFQFGDNIALYFAFLNMYFTSLLPVAVLGFTFWACNVPYSPMYAVVLVLWACSFIESWRLRERTLAVRWGTTGLSNVPERCTTFHPRAVERDAATGEQIEVFEWWRRELRMLAAVPVILLFATLIVVTLTAIFSIEVIAAEVYDGPWKSIVTLVPTILFSTCVPVVLAVWRATACGLTEWENYATTSAHDRSLTYKIFGLQSLVTYGGLMLTAFAYIPYGEAIMERIYDNGLLDDAFQLLARHANVRMLKKPNFHISPDRLSNQLFALCVTAQVTNTAMETVLPIVLRAASNSLASVMRILTRKEPARKEEQRVSFANDSLERKFLSHVEAEFELPVYDSFVDYAEMATQVRRLVHALLTTVR